MMATILNFCPLQWTESEQALLEDLVHLGQTAQDVSDIMKIPLPIAVKKGFQFLEVPNHLGLPGPESYETPLNDLADAIMKKATQGSPKAEKLAQGR